MKISKALLDKINRNPLYTTIGIRVTEVKEGMASSWLEPRENVCWPFEGQPHGGILFTLMDTTMAWAVLSELEPSDNCATVNLSIQYTSPARGGRFNCRAWITYRTSRLSFVRSEISDTDGHLLAMGQATFRVIGRNAERREE